jgi:hypothetical protein
MVYVPTLPRRQEETKDYIAKFLAQQDEARQRQREAQAAEEKKIAGGTMIGMA